jgi:hypothetical protein
MRTDRKIIRPILNYEAKPEKIAQEDYWKQLKLIY